MRYIDESLLHLHRLHQYVYDETGRKWAEAYEREIRDIIAGSTHLSAVPHLKAQLAADRPLWEILALVDLYEEALQPALEARDAGAEALVAEAVPTLQAEFGPACLDFCALYPTAAGESARVVLPASPAQSAELVLKGLSMDDPLRLEDPIWWELTWQGAGYRLAFFTQGFETLELDFDGLEFRRQFYHAGSCFGHVEHPWQLLFAMAAAILEKYRADPALLNAQETGLLPMLHALRSLEHPVPEGAEEYHTAPLLEQLQTHGLGKAAKALQALAAAPDQKRNAKYARLMLCLRQADCEPLWRQLYQAIWSSQEGLPFATQGAALEAQRRQVTETLRAMGFQGEYPFFWQEGPKRRLTLLRSYEQDYLVGMERHGVYMVQALEIPAPDQPEIGFLSGTVFLRRKQQLPGAHPDLFTAMFEEKGRRCFQSLHLLHPNLTPGQKAVIAAKKARLEPLTREERKSLVQFPAAGILLLALLMGLLFGLLFTLLFGLLAGGILLIGGVPEAIRDFPWLFCFLFSGLGFGGCMGVVMLLQSRK